MAGRIPENILEDILSRIDIAELIAGYIPLKRSGRNFKTTCPFHQEKTPSFMVSSDKQIYHCFGCFPAGSLVKTEKGFHKIEEVKAGQMVLTHRGRFMPIIRTLWRPYNGRLLEIYTRKSGLPVTLTSGHEVYVIKTKKCRYKSRENKICQSRCKLRCPEKFFNKYKIEKLPAEQLSLDDYLLYPINQEVNNIKFIDLDKYYNRKISNFGPDIKSIPTKILIDEKFLKLIGYWIAEGSNHRAYIRFSLGNHEEEFAREIKELVRDIFHIEASIHMRKKGKKTGIEISACNSKLANIFENLCGKLAENKHIPFDFQILPVKKQMIILEAIFRGDGCIQKVPKCKKDRKYKTITTISLILAEQLKDILLREGISPILNTEAAKIDKNGTNHRTAYTILWQEDSILHFSDIVKSGNISYQIVPIRKIIKNDFLGNVYNLTVAGDHSYTTPNFVVGNCGKGGNAFHFLMEYERMEFPEAVEALAKKAGVTLPKPQKEDEKTVSLFTQLYKINELTALFYENNLKSLPAGQNLPKDYLLKRGIKEESIKLFKIGFALEKWDALINHLRAKGISLALLEKAGLVLAKDSGGYYDRFRNRIIFPIFDIKSRPLGFGARVMDASLPKYINSPETPIYIKGNNLYGLNFSKDAIRDSDCAVVVEGYLDFIIPYQEGCQNIVASQGTALTHEQVRLLKRYTHNIVMIYDADTAGELATLRSLDIFIEEGMNVKIASLSKGLDPDLFVRKNGIDEFKKQISCASNLFDYKIGILKSRYNIKDIEGKAKIAADMLFTINKFKNAVLRSEYVRLLAEELKVKEEALLQELAKFKADSPFAQPDHISKREPLKVNPTEKLLIKLMLEETALIEHIRENLDPADFQDQRVSRIVALMFDLSGQGRQIGLSALMNHIAQEDISQIICESAFLEIPGQNKEKVVADCIQRLKNEKLKQKKQHLHDRIKIAQASGDESGLNNLMQEFHQLIKQETIR